jgi:Retrotransposon gag protein
MLPYTWLLDSMVLSIAVTVDDIQSVKDIWAKLKRIYAGAESNMRVFQIEREIETVVQGDRSIQEYATDLERLWADLVLADSMLQRSDVQEKGARCTEKNYALFEEIQSDF